MGLRVLKINDGDHSLPRPSRKGNLANVVWQQTCIRRNTGIRGKGQQNEGEYRTYSARLKRHMHKGAIGNMVGLSGSKH